MITLKDYQERVLDSLREFFRIAAGTRDPDAAFRDTTRRLGETTRYLPVQAEGLGPGMPYVCLRVPTGGGKTLLACYAAGLAQREFMRAERAVVLWLVPSNTILDQTADALRDSRHPYRRALDLACGAVEVVTIEEALRLSRATVEGQTVVIVSTIQSFRVEDTTVRQAEQAFGGSGKTRKPSPYEQQLDFFVPLLCFNDNGMLYEFESTFLLEHPWKLSEKDASLSGAYNLKTRLFGKTAVVDVGTKGEVQTIVMGETAESDFVGTLHQQVLHLNGVGDWSIERLVVWLDREIDHRDIPAGESAEFMRRVIRGLMAKFGIVDIGTLALDRFRLRDEIATRIQEHRDSERKSAFQQLMLPGSSLAVDEGQTINFRTMGYEPSRKYEGGFQFQKHYFGPKPGELAEKTADGRLTEEFQCAQFLDGLSEVRFWVRNLPRKATSFRLQTSKDWFYPDFVCELTDGRVLAVEYKGKHLYDGNDAEEKRTVGAVWASRSGGRCLFVMPTEGDFSVITRAIMPV